MGETQNGQAKSQEAGPARSRGRRGCAIGCLALILLAVGAWAGFRAYWGHKVRVQLEAIRAQGLPVTLEELNAWYPTPVGRNAADVYIAAAGVLVKPDTAEDEILPRPVGTADAPARGEPMPAEMLAAVRAFLEKNTKALALLHEAAGIEECRYPLDFTQGMDDLTVPHLEQLRYAGCLLGLQARARAQEGDAEGAVGAVADTLALARSLEKEPTLPSQLVRTAVLFMAIDATGRVLSLAPLTEDQVAALDDDLRAAEGSDAFWRGLAGDRCLVSASFRDLTEEYVMRMGPVNWVLLEWTGLQDLSRPGYLVRRWIGLEDVDHSTSLRLMSARVDASRQPLRERIRLARELDMQARGERLPYYCLIAREGLPEFDMAITEHCKRLTHLRVARVGLAVERYRLAHGALPGKLDDLVPEYLDKPPLDPYDGKPLRYKKLEKGYVVYSIGPDEKDDGGRERDSEQNPDDYDVTFIVAR